MMSERQLALAAGVFRVLSQTVNLELCQYLLNSRPMSQADLARHFRVSQPAMAQRLEKARRSGLVGLQKDGRRKIYFLIKSEAIQATHQFVGDLKKSSPHKKSDRPVDPNHQRLLTATFAALSEVKRLRLCGLLAESGELPFKALMDGARMSQPATSEHIKILAAAGLIRDRQDQKNLRFHFYSLANSTELIEALECIRGISHRGRNSVQSQNHSESVWEKTQRDPGFHQSQQPDQSDQRKNLYVCYEFFCLDAQNDGREMPAMDEREFFTARDKLDYRQRQRWDEFYVRGYWASKSDMIRVGYLNPNP